MVIPPNMLLIEDIIAGNPVNDLPTDIQVHIADDGVAFAESSESEYRSSLGTEGSEGIKPHGNPDRDADNASNAQKPGRVNTHASNSEAMNDNGGSEDEESDDDSAFLTILSDGGSESSYEYDDDELSFVEEARNTVHTSKMKDSWEKVYDMKGKKVTEKVDKVSNTCDKLSFPVLVLPHFH